MKQRKAKNGVVYVISDGQRFKVGHTKNITQRLRQLQTGASERLTVIASMPGEFELERSLHQRLKPLQAIGEWFHDGPELIEVVLEIWSYDTAIQAAEEILDNIKKSLPPPRRAALQTHLDFAVGGRILTVLPGVYKEVLLLGRKISELTHFICIGCASVAVNLPSEGITKSRALIAGDACPLCAKGKAHLGWDRFEILTLADEAGQSTEPTARYWRLRRDSETPKILN